MTTVLICEDRQSARQDLMGRLAHIAGVDRVQVCASSAQLVDFYARIHPDLVLLGASSMGAVSAATITTLLQAHPEAHVLMLTGREDREAAAAAVAAGARGYLTREGGRTAFTSSVVGALAGRSLIVARTRDSMPAQPSFPPVTLTERELQVLRGMSQGRSNAEIGRSLYLSEDTIKTHARRLFRKLGVNDRAKAVAFGFRQGLVS